MQDTQYINFQNNYLLTSGPVVIGNYVTLTLFLTRNRQTSWCPTTTTVWPPI